MGKYQRVIKFIIDRFLCSNYSTPQVMLYIHLDCQKIIYVRILTQVLTSVSNIKNLKYYNLNFSLKNKFEIKCLAVFFSRKCPSQILVKDAKQINKQTTRLYSVVIVE